MTRPSVTERLRTLDLSTVKLSIGVVSSKKGIYRSCHGHEELEAKTYFTFVIRIMAKITVNGRYLNFRIIIRDVQKIAEKCK